jgi:selenocysteine-specific elongation factor
MIIGTAGHIDHGKTSLVRALTGVDTDRLPEEKRRGITIELGFAPLELEGRGTVGIVDVPGHEAFVRTMVAGATGIDVALLVVAADEGVMPQTREHLDILTLLGTRAGVVALTRCDLVDADWLELVRDEVRGVLQGTALTHAPVVATSVVDGRGLAELRAALGAAVDSVPGRRMDDIFRMPVDRVFSVKGTGTVVTGTVWSGRLGPGDQVLVVPPGRPVRVRAVQSHGREVDEAGPGIRAAVALSGVEGAEIPRGATVCGNVDWPTTRLLRAEVALLESAGHTVRPREWLRFHLGTADVGARIVASGGAVSPGERRPVRVVLQEPVLARAGDRFVLRLPSPSRTIGGGIVVDPLPATRKVRPWPFESDAVLHLTRLLEEAGSSGVPLGQLHARTGLGPTRLSALLAESTCAEEIGGWVYAADVLHDIRDRISRAVNSFHERYPLADGLPIAECVSALGARQDVVDRVISRLVVDRILQRQGAIVARSDWAPRLTEADRQFRDSLLHELEQAGAEPPDVAGLTALHHRDPMPVLRILEREGRVLQVDRDRYVDAAVARRLVDKLRGAMTVDREYSPAELRDILGLSRKYLIPFLEYCDRMRITERRATGRVIVGP